MDILDKTRAQAQDASAQSAFQAAADTEIAEEAVSGTAPEVKSTIDTSADNIVFTPATPASPPPKAQTPPNPTPTLQPPGASAQDDSDKEQHLGQCSRQQFIARF